MLNTLHLILLLYLTAAIQSLTTTATSATKQVLTSHPITVQIHQTQQGTRLMIPSGSLPQLPG